MLAKTRELIKFIVLAMSNIRSIILLILIVFQSNALAERKKLVLAGDYWCPYNCNPNSDNQGFLVDLIKRSLYIYGIDIEYKIMPWHEALHKVEEGEIDGIIGISRVKGKNIMVTDMPLEYSSTASFTRCDTDWTYDGISSLRGKKLGIIMDYSLDEDVSNFVGTHYPSSPSRFVLEDGSNAVVDSISNLIDQKIDVYIEDRRVVESYIKERGLSNSIRNAGPISDEKLPLYVAFNDQIPDVKNYIRYLNEGTASLKSTGEYKHLREKYKIDASDNSVRAKE